MARRSSLVKVVIGLAVLAMFGLLFIRSIRSTRAAPYAVQGQNLTKWTLVVQPPQDPLRSWLALSPPVQLPSSLGREVFSRGGESVHYPASPLVPLLLHSEFDRAFAGRVAPEDIVSLARAAAFESIVWEPRCMGHRRVSEPGASRGVYFLLLEATPFERFRQQLSELLRAPARDLYDPAALSPVLIVAGLDGNFGRWMPLRADPEADCLAPVEATY
jgi:hypothetical protein